MKNPLRLSLAALALSVAATGLVAQPAPKVATVDVRRIYENYYKTEATNAKLQDDKKKAEDQIGQMRKEGEALGKELQETVEQSKNTVLTEEARKKALEDAQKKNEEFRRKESEFQEFVQNTQRLLQERLQRYQQSALEDISKVAVDLAKKKGATLVLNRSAEALVLFSDPSYDITDEVLTEVNKDRPAGTGAIKIDPNAAK